MIQINQSVHYMGDGRGIVRAQQYTQPYSNVMGNPQVSWSGPTTEQGAMQFAWAQLNGVPHFNQSGSGGGFSSNIAPEQLLAAQMARAGSYQNASPASYAPAANPQPEGQSSPW